MIQLNTNKYSIKRHCQSDCTLYEVYTDCQKLFTLKRGADGEWKTEEDDIIPIDDQLLGNIGSEIENYELA